MFAFPTRFADFYGAFSIGLNNSFEFLNRDDYILIMNHDCQRNFGISANEIIIYFYKK
uniref:hypothetical protein n=1 Tax=Flavobacterium sp. TaxID=239 RepID=UPI0040477F87